MSEMNRMRWRSRRGMLELDIVLSGFLDRHGETLCDAQIKAYIGLLEYPDGELWDIITGRRGFEGGDTGLLELMRMD